MKVIRKYRDLAIGGVLLVAGIGCGIAYFANPANLFQATVMLVGIGGGAFILWRARHRVTAPESAEVARGVNALVLGDRRVTLEEIPDPEGFPVRIVNNGKMVYLYQRTEAGDLSPYVLPDRTSYYDPEEFATAISMPAHAKLFERSQTLLEQLGPWAIVVGMLIVGVVLIAVE